MSSYAEVTPTMNLINTVDVGTPGKLEEIERGDCCIFLFEC